MKTIQTILLLSLMGIISCQSQTDKKTTEVSKAEKQVVKKEMNLLDEQTKIFGQIFDLGGAGDENPMGGATNYLEFIENSEMSEEQKEQLREMYKVYDLSLDPKKKDSLKLMVDKMLKTAIEKTQNDTNNNK